MVALAALVLATTLVASSRTGFFRVRGVEVEGNARLSRAAVIRLAGITPSTNAVWLDEGTVEERLEENAWIARAWVRVDLPWSVHVRVVERTPVAMVESGTTTVLVAGDGTVLGSARSRRGLPTIQAPPAWIRLGTPTSVVEAARALAALDPDVLSKVLRLQITPMSTLEIVLRKGVRVSYGAGRSFEDKARAITAVLAWADEEGERLRAITVSAPSAPSVAFAS